VPKSYPREFREDMVRVARQGEAPLKQVAADFGIAESCLRNWIRKADVDDGVRPGTTEADSCARSANGFGYWSGRTRCCAARRPISHRPICDSGNPQNSVPADP
jgi:hypothetical protein